MQENIKTVLEYHNRTKHHFDAYARGPGHLDWASKPEPFRRYAGARIVRLARSFHGHSPSYERALITGGNPCQDLNASSISQLFFDSLAISAWKGYDSERWALRVNPSSGNLHPTEAYLICGVIEDLTDSPAVCHYAPDEHILEVRTNFTSDQWESLTRELPDNAILIDLTSIY
jgi:hypothetical protein